MHSCSPVFGLTLCELVPCCDTEATNLTVATTESFSSQSRTRYVYNFSLQLGIDLNEEGIPHHFNESFTLLVSAHCIIYNAVTVGVPPNYCVFVSDCKLDFSLKSIVFSWLLFRCVDSRDSYFFITIDDFECVKGVVCLCSSTFMAKNSLFTQHMTSHRFL